MVYLHKYDYLNKVIGTTSITPYVGQVRRNKRVVMASSGKFGRKVNLIKDEKHLYFKPEINSDITTDFIVSSTGDGGNLTFNYGLGIDCMKIGDMYEVLLRKPDSDIDVDNVHYYAYNSMQPFSDMNTNFYITTDNEGLNYTGIYIKDNENIINVSDQINYKASNFVEVYVYHKKTDDKYIQKTITLKSGSHLLYTIDGEVFSMAHINIDELSKKSITYIKVPYGVSDTEALFKDCISLSEIELPGTVQKIGNKTFYGCEELVSIDFPKSVTSIGDYAFYACNSLVNFKLPDTILTVGKYAFYKCDNLESLDFGSSIVEIGDYACNYESSLKNIVFGKNLKKIGAAAFQRCGGLTSIEIPDSVEIVGHNAFDLCTNVTSLKLGKNVKDIDMAFTYLSRLKEVTIPSSLSAITCSFPNCFRLENVTIPKSIKVIGYDTFYQCKSLKDIILPQNLTFIGNDAFNLCTSLTSVTIPDKVEIIDNTAFNGCTGLTTVNLGSSLNKIGNSAFGGCTNLELIVYNGTKTNWNSIEKGTDWIKNIKSDAKVKFSDGTTMLLN